MSQENRPRILIVDDRPENLLAMEHVLAGLDADLVKAGSGNEALTRLLHQEFAVVLLDVQMPDMDGFEVASLMQDRQTTRDTPIIFVTAISKDEKYVFEGYKRGGVDYVFKPVDPTILKSKVDVFLKLHQQKQLLAQHNAALEERNEELNSFSHIVAHEIKEPLRIVSGFAEYLKGDYKGRLNDKADGYLRRIDEECRRMTQAVESLLEYADTGRARMSSERENLESLVEQALSALEHTIRETGTRVEVCPLPTVRGDRARLIRVFQSLISNAIKFRGDEPPCVRIAADREGEFWRISVADNGLGIDDDFHKSVFAPLRRLYEDKYEGTGLGLAMCRRIVEQHGGRIWIQPTAPGNGTTFFLTLPAAEQPSRPDLGTQVQPSRGGQEVLIEESARG